MSGAALKARRRSLLSLVFGKAWNESSIVSFCPESKFVRFQADGFAYSNQPSYGIREWLYSLDKDPREKANLVAREPRVVSKMRAEAEKTFKQKIRLRDILNSGENEKVKADRDLLELLKALGYIK